ncbi:diacylglycerol/lipid kinase family protein [Streptomyces sp. NBC_00557]|uniref:diacylglycerol/lipid kinase family protein n=1 Tax=Streptomyces sp. NBC_00557 TaxID=2975776 RepID=UPI002E823270|nr:diacylglycerol kinase family protein [Streptomyces sp. NBC_00557]
MSENAARPTTGARRPWLIVNPRSGGGKASRFRIAERACAFGAQVFLIDPSLPQDVATVARRAVDDGADLLGVAGGDGTQALVAEVAAESGLPFVVIPAGTRNHFAMDLGLDREDPSAALEALRDGVELRVGLGYAGERAFVNNVSFGACAALVQDPAYRDDKLGTAVRILPELPARHEGPELVVRTGLLTVDGPDAVLVSSNPYQFDDPAGLGRRAHLDSGLLGVLTARAETPAETAARLRGGQPHNLAGLATPDDVVVYAAAPAPPPGWTAKPSDCRLPCGVKSALEHSGYGFPGIVPAPSLPSDRRGGPPSGGWSEPRGAAPAHRACSAEAATRPFTCEAVTWSGSI